MDIDFDGARRNRVQRKRDAIVDMTNALLEVATAFIEHVYNKLPK